MSVITISFVSAGLLALRAGMLVIFGANLGTTTGAWLMAAFGMKVNLSAYAMPMLVFGLIFMLQKRRPWEGVGRILAGVGFLFLGIHYMKEGFEAAQASIDLAQYAMTGILGVLVYTLVGMVVTVVMQSSHATMMLIIAALATGQVSYENALALAIGANVGTTISAVLGALGSNAAGRRLAGAHVVFNVLTGVVAIAAIVPLAALVDVLARATGIAPDDWTLKLALFHTVFNIVGIAISVPIVDPLARALTRRFAEPTDTTDRAIYLNRAALGHPATALAVLEKETQHLLDNGFEILAHAIGLHRADILSDRPLNELVMQHRDRIDDAVLDGYYRRIKAVYNEIVAFASDAAPTMSAQQRDAVQGLRIACRDIAQAVKAMAYIIPSLERWGNGEHPEMRRQYDALRLQIARLLRRVYRVKVADDPELRFEGLHDARAEAEQADVLANGTIDHLVRDDVITSQAATSLMNDSAHVWDISQWLLEAASRMYVANDPRAGALRAEVLAPGLPSPDYASLRRDALTTSVPALREQSLTAEYRRIVGASGDAPATPDT